MTHIKICGIKEEAHALAVAEAGADFIGFVFAPSSRQLTPAQAERITSVLKKHNTTAALVGVFVNMPTPVVERIVDFCHLDWVQLSGDESWAYCQGMNRPLIKAIRVSKPKKTMADLATGARALEGKKHMYLLDAHVKDRYGGTGETFDWEVAREAAAEYPVILAGGLNPDNVAQAIKTAAPWGVDVSSGVETEGVKDMTKVTNFIEAVRRADAGQT